MQANIGVIGAGAWGSALAMVLSRKGHRVLLWDNDPRQLQQLDLHRENRTHLPGIRLPDTLQIELTLAKTCSESDILLLVVPSHAFPLALREIQTHLTRPIPIIWATKGLNAETGQPLHVCALEILGADYPIGVMSGPSFSTEVAQGCPTVVNIAAQTLNSAEYYANLFTQANFHAVPTTDIIGVQLGGAVKNVIAIVTGICDGLHLGTNARCAVITRGLQEMAALGLSLGASWETFISFAGVGDLVLTCSDDQSRNRRFGLAIGQGSSAAAALKQLGTVEGVTNAEQVQRLAAMQNVKMPLVEKVSALLANKISPQELISGLFDV